MTIHGIITLEDVFETMIITNLLIKTIKKKNRIFARKVIRKGGCVRIKH